VFYYRCFNHVHGKKDPHIRIPAAFPASGQGKPGGENSLGLKAFGDHYMRGKSAVF
jgi:hypothetical protein